jgi:hypothetical protein
MPLLVQRRAGIKALLLPALVIVLVLGSLVGCSDDDSQVGPGPIGPVGPVGNDDGIPGSGTITTEGSPVTGFDRLAFRSEGNVIVTTGAAESLTIETDDNLHQYLEASVRNGVLEISTAEGIDIAPTEPPVYRVGMAAMAGVELSGAGSIDIASITADRFAVTLSGVGDVTIGALVTDELVLDLTGVGMVSVSGTADRQEGLVAGVSIYDAADLESRSATIEAAGTGEATIWVVADLEVTAADTASVSYYGTPSVTQTTSSLGTVVPLGDR